VLTTHNRMLDAQIARKAIFSYTPPNRLPGKLEPNPREHYNYVTLKEEVEDFTDHEDIPMEEARKIIMAGSKERNDVSKTAAFI